LRIFVDIGSAICDRGHYKQTRQATRAATSPNLKEYPNLGVATSSGIKVVMHSERMVEEGAGAKINAEDSPKPPGGLPQSSGRFSPNPREVRGKPAAGFNGSSPVLREFWFSARKTRTNVLNVKRLQTGLTKMKCHSARFSI